VSLTLLDYRRRVAAAYQAVREAGDADADRAAAADAFRGAKDALFGSHPDSPIGADVRANFAGLRYWPYNPAWRFAVEVDTDVEPDRLALFATSGEPTPFTRFGVAHLPVGDLDVYWLESYGGGVFVPVADATNGDSTYGGGRYLLDTVKGADLGSADGRLVLDFNYAYHPSCFYDSRWACPLARPGSRLASRVEAGEMSG
jgi:uncharacterized protein (DUF1684 family)